MCRSGIIRHGGCTATSQGRAVQLRGLRDRRLAAWGCLRRGPWACTRVSLAQVSVLWHGLSAVQLGLGSVHARFHTG
eukprot:354069-Chlamydomonas_euryale.AAC.17